LISNLSNPLRPILLKESHTWEVVTVQTKKSVVLEVVVQDLIIRGRDKNSFSK